MSRSKVFVFDSLYKTTNKSRYKDVVELIKTAWTYLYEKYPRKFNKNLYVHYDWPVCVLAYSLRHDLVFLYVQVMTQRSSTNLCEYYVCEYMHLVIAYTDSTKFEEKVRADTTATTCTSYCSYSSIHILLFIFFGRLAKIEEGFLEIEQIRLVQE
jgi:hypothetical protein